MGNGVECLARLHHFGTQRMRLVGSKIDSARAPPFIGSGQGGQRTHLLNV